MHSDPSAPTQNAFPSATPVRRSSSPEASAPPTCRKGYRRVMRQMDRATARPKIVFTGFWGMLAGNLKLNPAFLEDHQQKSRFAGLHNRRRCRCSVKEERLASLRGVLLLEFCLQRFEGRCHFLDLFPLPLEPSLLCSEPSLLSLRCLFVIPRNLVITYGLGCLAFYPLRCTLNLVNGVHRNQDGVAPSPKHCRRIS
jgi:hypothetical protein